MPRTKLTCYTSYLILVILDNSFYPHEVSSPALVSIVIEFGTPQSDSVTPMGRLVAHQGPPMVIFLVLMVKFSTSNSGLEKSVKLLIPPDGQLQMQGGNPLHLQILTYG